MWEKMENFGRNQRIVGENRKCGRHQRFVVATREFWERQGIVGDRENYKRREKCGIKMDYLIHRMGVTTLCIWKKTKLYLIHTNKL